jgi:hypothetical protein
LENFNALGEGSTRSQQVVDQDDAPPAKGKGVHLGSHREGSADILGAGFAVATGLWGRPAGAPQEVGDFGWMGAGELLEEPAERFGLVEAAQAPLEKVQGNWDQERPIHERENPLVVVGQELLEIPLQKGVAAVFVVLDPKPGWTKVTQEPQVVAPFGRMGPAAPAEAWAFDDSVNRDSAAGADVGAHLSKLGRARPAERMPLPCRRASGERLATGNARAREEHTYKFFCKGGKDHGCLLYVVAGRNAPSQTSKICQPCARAGGVVELAKT